MSIASIALLLPLAAEEHGGAGIGPFVIGGGALLILFAMLFALMAFGKGRDHS